MARGLKLLIDIPGRWGILSAHHRRFRDGQLVAIRSVGRSGPEEGSRAARIRFCLLKAVGFELAIV
jgi:hypothetical protein